MQDQPLPSSNPDDPYHVVAPRPKGEGIKSFLSTVLLLVLAPMVAIFLTMFVFQSYEVDGPSMETTLHNGDRLIVLKLPRTLARVTGKGYIPNRGDVIIFNRSGLNNIADGSSKQLIKRVIGLPGDRVVVKNGELTVYSKEHPDGFFPDKTMPYGSAIKTTPGDVDITVGEGEIFVCGDNRANSLDSRYFGTVAVHDIVGKLGLKVYPFGQSEVF